MSFGDFAGLGPEAWEPAIGNSLEHNPILTILANILVFAL